MTDICQSYLQLEVSMLHRCLSYRLGFLYNNWISLCNCFCKRSRNWEVSCKL